MDRRIDTEIEGFVGVTDDNPSELIAVAGQVAQHFGQLVIAFDLHVDFLSVVLGVTLSDGGRVIPSMGYRSESVPLFHTPRT
ncbi:hypothetical protein D3C86_1911420 [compost metagenome]